MGDLVSLFLHRSGILRRGQSGGGGGGWTPADLWDGSYDGGWWDASVNSSMYSIEGAAYGPANGDHISEWRDQAVNGTHLTNAGASAGAPNYLSAGPKVEWDTGDNDELSFSSAQSAGFGGSANKSFFCVAEFPSAPEEFMELFDINNSSTNGRTWVFRIRSGKLAIAPRGGDFISSLTPGTSGKFLAGVVLDGTTLADHTLYLGNSSEAATGTQTINTDVSGTTLVGGERGPKYIYEAIAIAKAVSASEITSLRSYWNSKWSLGL